MPRGLAFPKSIQTARLRSSAVCKFACRVSVGIEMPADAKDDALRGDRPRARASMPKAENRVSPGADLPPFRNASVRWRTINLCSISPLSRNATLRRPVCISASRGDSGAMRPSRHNRWDDFITLGLAGGVTLAFLAAWPHAEKLSHYRIVVDNPFTAVLDR